ncbi:MAG: hypothetical protein LUQ71_00590 [Methanoregula sp.]|jgi:hypothetical protein|nr:hypothetical protein [Methanoregula sp.]
MNFGTIGGIGGAAVSYLQTPEGQETVKKFLASPEGIALLQNFAGTPEGKKTLMSVLPTVLSGLNLPAGASDMITNALKTQQ